MRKILCSILILIMIISILKSSYAQEGTNVVENETEDSAQTELDQERDELEGKIEESELKLEYVQEELSQNLLEVQELDKKIIEAELEIQQLTIEIEILLNEVEEIEEILNTAEERYNTQKDIFEERLIAIYEQGEMSYLEILLQSEGIIDFFSNYYLITEIAKNDAIIVDELETQKNTIEIEKAKLDKQTEQLAEKKQNQTVTNRILENTIGVREHYVAQLSEQERSIQSEIDQYINSFQEVNREILLLAQGGIGTKYIGGELAWPVPGYSNITSEYGMRTHPVTGVYALHNGLDIGAPTGVDFVSANDGIVTKSEYDFAYGNMVVVDHGGGVTTLYAHGSEILVEVGESVTRGQPVLKIGSTGYSTGPHAHFEVRFNGISTDPLPYITTGLVPNTQDTSEISTQEEEKVED